MTEKRVFLAAGLSALFLAVYAQFIVPKTTRTSPAQQASPGISQNPPAKIQTIIPQLIEHESVITVESEDLRVEIGKTTGSVHRVELKRFSGNHESEALAFSSPIGLVSAWPGDSAVDWTMVHQSAGSVEFEAKISAQENYHLSYVLDTTNPLLNIVLVNSSSIDKASAKSAVFSNSWSRGDQLTERNNPMDFTIQQREQKDGKIRHRHFGAQRGKERIVPRGTILLALSERHFCQIVRFGGAEADTTLIPAPNGAIAALSRVPIDGEAKSASATVYFGPRDFFYLKKVGLESAFPTGAFAQIGLILLMVLSFLSRWTHNYGVAVILFSVLITCVMAPFTLMGYKSMKKMQTLKPEMDKILARHGGDQKKASPELMAIFKQHRVSPIGGCLPMLLQLPIFFALIQAISHYVELRGKSFLWIRDLSLPDRLMELPFGLPLLGSHINLLPILTAAAMFFQTKLSQSSMSMDQSNPTAKMMSGPMMPILFGFMFYQVPAGLVLYWLTNSLMSMALYRTAR